MNDKFNIKVNGSDWDLRNCEYDDDDPKGIFIGEHNCMTRERCHAILRELAKRSDEKPIIPMRVRGTNGAIPGKYEVTVRRDSFTEKNLEEILNWLYYVNRYPLQGGTIEG